MELDEDEYKATREFYEMKRLENKLFVLDKWIQKPHLIKSEKKENK